MGVAPMKIGLHHYEKMMTSRSTPVVVSIAPGHVRVASAQQVLLDAPAQAVSVKRSRMVGHLTLTSGPTKLILAAVGAANAGTFSPEQAGEIQAAQAQLAQNPPPLRLATTLWVGEPTAVDGGYWGAFASLHRNEARNQREIGEIVEEALLAVGASKG